MEDFLSIEEIVCNLLLKSIKQYELHIWLPHLDDHPLQPPQNTVNLILFKYIFVDDVVSDLGGDHNDELRRVVPVNLESLLAN